MDPNLFKGSVELYPHAKLTGIRFGLLSSEHIRKISVYDRKGECRLEVNDNRLGLPNQEFMCGSCGERHPMKCEGHFGHIVLKNAVYHPNYVSQIVKMLNRLCLCCLSLKVKTKKSPKGMGIFSLFMERVDDSVGCEIDVKPKMKKSDSFSVKGKGKTVDCAPSTCSALICLPKTEPGESSEMLMQDDKEFVMNPDRLALVPLPPNSESNGISQNARGKHQESARKVVIDLSSDDEDNARSPLNTSTLRKTVSGNQRKNVVSGRQKSSQTPANETVEIDTGKSKCKYCKQGSYPNISIKVERSVHVDSQRNNSVVEKIYLEFDEEDSSARDYLKNLGKQPEDLDTGKEYLLPSEVLKILKKVSDKVVSGLKIDSKVSRPEALVLQEILIPPNCNRIPEKPGVAQWKYGSDEITKKLRAILRFKHNHDREMARMISIEKMQSLISQYFRLKGAPKVRGNKEPMPEYVSRAQSKKDIRKSSCSNKLHDLIVAKVCSFSARAVLTGDAFLSLNEIGIPMEVSKGLTVWETVTQHNFENMKNDYSQEHGNFTALMYIRSGVKTDLTQCEVYNVEIGDEIARPIKDGDLVFCNRPPSVHKHSLIGLKVRILDIPTFAINPLICPPMGADFDGDCLAVFVPQSMGSRAEIDLVMAENQFLTSHGGACTFGLTQDSLLAAHKLTSSPILIKRETMEQGCLWSDSCMPRPAIVKSPKGAFFTGCQLYQLPLPRDFDYSEPGILVSGGEILESRGKAGWAANSNGLLRSIVEKYGCHLALNYLSSCQMMLTLWLSQVGFSAGLRDVYETRKSKTRGGMKNEIMQAFDEFEYRINTKIRSLDYLCSKQDEYSGSFVRDCGVEARSSFEGLRLQYMQELISRIQDVTLKYVPEENSMMKMVASGSKGSVKKFVEQFGCLGFQTLRGKHTVTLEKDKFVRNSFIEGLTPHEFMMQTISFRDTAIYQALRVSEPGVLFKNLMLFGRDIHVYYDGTVRNHHDNHVIQFLYGGLRGHKEENSEEREIKNLQRDPKDLAGEPVGILAAMAIAQPAYEALLESAKVSANSSHSCPLKHLQDTLYCQKVLKQNDRKVILYMSGSRHMSKEKSAIRVQKLLRHVNLDMLLVSTSIIYVGDSGSWEALVPAENSPWIVHLSLSEVAMTTWNVTVEEVVQKLKRDHQCKDLSFHSRDQCDTSCPDSSYLLGLACISFCISHGERCVEDPLSEIKDKIIPGIRGISIMGDARVESISVLPSGMTSESWVTSMQREPCRDLEVAIEITIKETYVKNKSDAWHIVKELCIPVLDLIDWSLSMPCSVQGIMEMFGIEAAQKFIFQRLKAILGMFDKSIFPEHVLLVTDMMTHVGRVVGLTNSGLRDFINVINVSAPMTHGLFKNPVKHIQDAAMQGKSDDLSGTLASICWGKLAPVGTGANFEMLWRDLGM